MIPFISNLFNLPVTRKEVLKRAKRAKRHKRFGLCCAIFEALCEYNLYGTQWFYFPKFCSEFAKPFGGAGKFGYWWPRGEWNTGRMNFLDWLINEYKDDKTDLRKLKPM